MKAARRELTVAELTRGLKEFNQYARQEYGLQLHEVLKDGTQTEELRRERVGRLVGVMLKEPFAKPTPIEDPGDPSKSATRARRAWVLDLDSFRVHKNQNTWQYDVLEKLSREDAWTGSLPEFAEMLQMERRWFWYLIRSTRKYMCADPKFVKKLKNARILLPTGALGTGATLLANQLVAIGLLSVVSTPVVVGLVVLIGHIGIDAFCDWSDERLKQEFGPLPKASPKPRTAARSRADTRRQPPRRR